jgi:hypothetical protein
MHIKLKIQGNNKSKRCRAPAIELLRPVQIACPEPADGSMSFHSRIGSGSVQAIPERYVVIDVEELTCGGLYGAE